MSAILQKLISLSESETASDSKKALKRRRDDEDFNLRPCREEKFFRTRWREGYLRNLAENEYSFIGEYRLDPVSFDLLSEMIEPDLDVDAKIAKISTKSARKPFILD
jgi:hypothetical protein